MLIGGLAALSALTAVIVCWGKEWLTWLWLLPVGFAGSFAIFALLAFLAVLISCAVVRLDRPQEQDSPYYRWLVRLLAEAGHTILAMRVHAAGLEKTPKDGRFLLVCNHLNDFDPVVLLHHFRHSRLAFISKRENSTMFVVGKVMHKIQCQLINRENDKEALKTILRCIQIIKEDKASIAVFPEGGILSEDGKLHHFRPGVFKIAKKTEVPIVVCTMKNTKDAIANLLHLKKTDIEVSVLDVITPEQYAGMTTVELGNLVHDLMAKDLGPQYAPEEST